MVMPLDVSKRWRRSSLMGQRLVMLRATWERGNEPPRGPGDRERAGAGGSRLTRPPRFAGNASMRSQPRRRALRAARAMKEAVPRARSDDRAKVARPRATVMASASAFVRLSGALLL